MTRKRSCVLAVAWIGMSAALAADTANTKRHTIERSFPATAGTRLLVDGINGSIRARGYAGNEIRVTVREEMRGRREEDLQLAIQEIVLEIDADGNEVSFFVDTPWRDRRGGWHGRSQRRHYDFSHDFEIEVPFGVELDLRTVNGGDIRVDDVRSVVTLHNVNGRVEAVGIHGIRDVETVNGRIVLEFRQVPRDGGFVETVNGNVELTFPSEPDAHVRMKTFNGKLFSEFAYRYRDVAPAVESRRSDGMYVYRSEGMTEISIGNGGPEWTLETLNGNIYIRKDDRS